MNKPFNLEAFKAGQKALTRDGRVATCVVICEECEKSRGLVYRTYCNERYAESVFVISLEGNFYSNGMESTLDLVSMVSRHQMLIDAWHNGAQIEGRLTPYSEWVYLQYPKWDEDKEYRIKPEPKTKTVYEWIHAETVGNTTYYVVSWIADDDIVNFFGTDNPKHRYKTGRSWKVEEYV